MKLNVKSGKCKNRYYVISDFRIHLYAILNRGRLRKEDVFTLAHSVDFITKAAIRLDMESAQERRRGDAL